MKRKAAATWIGSLDDGQGELRSESGVLANSRYTFDARVGNGKGTNPEELMGAAHAACYSMALTKKLSERGIKAERIDTEATVTLERVNGGMSISEVHLETRVEAPGAEPKEVEQATQAAREDCIISRALAAPITLHATLVN
jgi:osmotically inducible protein OsmC